MAGLDRCYIGTEDDAWSNSAQNRHRHPNDSSDYIDASAGVISIHNDDAAVKKYVGLGVGLVSLITENLLSHPFVVLRRQCQVHNSVRYHMFPVTLVPIIVHLHHRQGITTLWKGVGSVLMIRGMTLAVEDIISKFTPWPKDISWHSSMKAFGQHLLLKCTTLAIVTPFYSASVVETVQSDIASEKPGIFDVFREGIYRLVSWSSPQKGRMLPIWTLVVPTIVHGLLKYLLSLVVKGITSRILHLNLHRERKRQGALPRDVPERSTAKDIELSAALVGFYTAEVAFYPLETILHRLHLQGTRTIIDDLDSGYEVTPIMTSYQGVWDCYETTLSEEGVAGLYRGFGALVFQLAAHVAVVRFTKFLLTELSTLVTTPAKRTASVLNPPPPAPLQTYN